jgi:hypothetical protein
MPILPLIFDTTLGLGATKLRDTSPYPFLHLRGRFEAPAAVVNFSPFCAGKLRRHAKIGCAVLRLCVGASPAKKEFNNTKINKGRDKKHEERAGYEA